MGKKMGGIVERKKDYTTLVYVDLTTYTKTIKL